MFNNVTQAYDLTDASLEILIMLLGAFILGWLFHWMFFKATCKPCARRDQKDDLTTIEGVGPKIAKLLNGAGIYSFQALSESNVDFLKGVLNAAGPRFKMHEPTTWAKQADLAANEKWQELEEYQDFLQGGKDHA